MSPIAAAPASAASLRGPFRLAVAILAVTTLTIVKGAMTTSTDSGLAYRDWPLSDGQLMPERSYTTVPGFLEHFHRLSGATLGLLSLALALWLQFGRVGDRRVRVHAWLGGCLVLVQGLIGGTHVLQELPVVTGVVHATLAQLTLAMFAWIAYQLSERHRATRPLQNAAPGTGRKLTLVALGFLVLQTVIGAIARHSNSPHALWTHAGNALVVFVVATITTALVTGRLGSAPGIRGLSRLVVMLLIAQIALGFVALLVRNDAGKAPENIERLGAAAVISTHVLFGALLTMLMATLAAHVFRATRGAGREGVEGVSR
jgi:cytochrome c oxidase assembly protein subunit 15